jgi:hypothetical protein
MQNACNFDNLRLKTSLEKFLGSHIQYYFMDRPRSGSLREKTKIGKKNFINNKYPQV